MQLFIAVEHLCLIFPNNEQHLRHIKKSEKRLLQTGNAAVGCSQIAIFSLGLMGNKVAGKEMEFVDTSYDLLEGGVFFLHNPFGGDSDNNITSPIVCV